VKTAENTQQKPAPTVIQFQIAMPVGTVENHGKK